MGNLIWHEYARFVSITATIYGIWAGFMGLLYRKYFWDFMGGNLRDPGGMQAPPSAAPMIAVIVKAPVVPIFAIVIGLVLLALEWPLPLLKSTGLYRSLVMRVVFLAVQLVLTILFYQGTNSAIWSFIALCCYTRAIMLGEEMKEAKENRGRGGSA